MPAKARRRPRAQHPDSDEDDIPRADNSSDDESTTTEDSDESDSDTEPDEKPFFAVAATPAAWADMVDDPVPHIPVIDFADLADPHTSDSDDPGQPRQDPRPAPSSSSRRVPGQSARQAYQQRLESDPSFVPTVGEFWGHDDRLLDKDLRSLSGWWRGRWQGRGRGAARGGPFPPRGRGGAAQHPSNTPDAAPPDDSPIDRTWTHDGFEEMRRREDQRRPQAPSQQRGGAPSPSQRGAAPLRGRGRGSAPIRAPGRTWFTMKPEHMWTKQHDAFLFLDAALRARPGHPPGVRVRVPNTPATVVRLLPRTAPKSKLALAPKAVESVEYAVRLPRKRAGKERAVVVVASSTPPNPWAPLKPDADGWVRPDPAVLAVVASTSTAIPTTTTTTATTTTPPDVLPQAQALPQVQALPQTQQHPQAPAQAQAHPQAQAQQAHLPPGVALDAHGLPYELASGRAVFVPGWGAGAAQQQQQFGANNAAYPGAGAGAAQQFGASNNNNAYPGWGPMHGHTPSLSMHGHAHTPSLSMSMSYPMLMHPYAPMPMQHGHSPSMQHGHSPSMHGHSPSMHGHSGSMHGHSPSMHAHSPSVHSPLHAPSPLGMPLPLPSMPPMMPMGMYGGHINGVGMNGGVNGHMGGGVNGHMGGDPALFAFARPGRVRVEIRRPGDESNGSGSGAGQGGERNEVNGVEREREGKEGEGRGGKKLRTGAVALSRGCGLLPLPLRRTRVRIPAMRTASTAVARTASTQA
ncbi:hypothetical protein C8J57DRAFT_755131 [Mycena rebaudengoi]|nr:hypothetical protein C8J57DRAFT_755131 [Mycena rebaudengoi]